MNDDMATKLCAHAFSMHENGQYKDAKPVWIRIIQGFPESPEAIRAEEILGEDEYSEGFVEDEVTETVITKIDIPFWSLTGFLVKFAFAMIPAAIVVGMVYLLLAMIMAAFGVSNMMG